MANGDILSDFGINLLEEEIDDVIFQTNEFLTDATFTGAQGSFWWILHGSGGTLLYRYGGRYRLQDDGEARTARRDEAVQTVGRVDYHLLVVSACGHGNGR